MSKIAAEAARDSAAVASEQVQMLLRQEAPLLHFRLTRDQPHVTSITDDEPLVKPITRLNYVFDNHGRTAAVVQFHEIRIEPTKLDIDEIRRHGRCYYDNPVIVGGKTSPDLFYEGRVFDEDVNVKIMLGKTLLFLGGRIIYQDVYERLWETRFRGEFSKDIQRWVIGRQQTATAPMRDVLQLARARGAQ